MKPYTVLLLRPDYISSNFGQDTYLAHVEADSTDEARELAQVEARNVDQLGVPGLLNDPEDYHVLFSCPGHVNDGEEHDEQATARPRGGLTNNTDLVVDLMTFSKCGPLSQVFVVNAIQQAADEVVELGVDGLAKKFGGRSMINSAAWFNVAAEIKERMAKFYDRHDTQTGDTA